MGMVAARSLATSVLADPGFLWEVPDTWTLEQAATVPVCYATVSEYFRSTLETNFERFDKLIPFSSNRATTHWLSAVVCDVVNLF